MYTCLDEKFQLAYNYNYRLDRHLRKWNLIHSYLSFCSIIFSVLDAIYSCLH